MLVNDNFEFPDLLGAAYEYLIKYFADSAGKKGGEFYTPKQVVRLMVEILKPEEGMTVYDPTDLVPPPGVEQASLRVRRRGEAAPFTVTLPLTAPESTPARDVALV